MVGVERDLYSPTLCNERGHLQTDVLHSQACRLSLSHFCKLEGSGDAARQNTVAAGGSNLQARVAEEGCSALSDHLSCLPGAPTVT